MASWKILLAVINVFSNFFFVSPLSLPHVNPGLFVIQGVSTCGHGDGYCLLSNSCLVDTDFEGDIEGGHCDGLKHAFNPHADFVCCKYMPAPTTITPTTVKTKPPPPPPSDDNTSYNLLVIQGGVSTCGNGGGFCLLSDSCSIVQSFVSDTEGGHCTGLKDAVNPQADFVCCKYLDPATATSTTPSPPTEESVSYNVVEIQGGVGTCGQGSGFCILSESCSLVQGFENDANNGHCSGVSKESDPKAAFVCCQYSLASTTNPTTTIATAPASVDNVVTSSPATTSVDESVSYNELEIQGGVSTCGNGGGFCLLSGSCEFIPGFQSDTRGGHCEGVSKSNPNSRANFVCCKYVPLSKIHNPTTSKNGKVNLPATTTPPPVLTSVTSAHRQTGNFPEKIGTSTARTSATVVDAKKTVSPFGIFANTNKILSGIQHLIYGGRMRPSAAMQKYGQNVEGSSNDKSMVSLILMGLKLNETTARSDLIN